MDSDDRERLETELRQARRLVTVSRLTGGMAHDFGNILTAIAAHAELASGALESGQADETRAELDEIRQAALRAGQMIKHLLRFSRSDHLTLREVELAAAVGAAGRLIRFLLPDSVRLEVDAAGRLPVLADPSAVEQILLNLAVNARDAMPAGGRLLLAVEQGRLDEAHLATHGWGTPGQYGIVRVSDTGTGMAPEVAGRVFEPFFTTKSAEEGSGLGLPLVYGLMKQHRGFVAIESERGRGTDVRLYFPLVPRHEAREAREARAAPPVPSAEEGPGRILFVEDDAALRELARRILQAEGYEVLEAANGLEALDVIRRSGPPDLVVTDLVMAGMGGGELVLRLMEREPWRREGSGAPSGILLTSGYDPAAVPEGRGLPSGVPFLEKPWTVAGLLGAVWKTLQGRPPPGA
jgi:nitrogen-specific signal transduction histidine kinase